jgi:hypothetical protein
MLATTPKKKKKKKMVVGMELVCSWPQISPHHYFSGKNYGNTCKTSLEGICN